MTKIVKPDDLHPSKPLPAVYLTGIAGYGPTAAIMALQDLESDIKEPGRVPTQLEIISLLNVWAHDRSNHGTASDLLEIALRRYWQYMRPTDDDDLESPEFARKLRQIEELIDAIAVAIIANKSKQPQSYRLVSFLKSIFNLAEDFLIATSSYAYIAMNSITIQAGAYVVEDAGRFRDLMGLEYDLRALFQQGTVNIEQVTIYAEQAYNLVLRLDQQALAIEDLLLMGAMALQTYSPNMRDMFGRLLPSKVKSFIEAENFVGDLLNLTSAMLHFLVSYEGGADEYGFAFEIIEYVYLWGNIGGVSFVLDELERNAKSESVRQKATEILTRAAKTQA